MPYKEGPQFKKEGKEEAGKKEPPFSKERKEGYETEKWCSRCRQVFYVKPEFAD